MMPENDGVFDVTLHASLAEEAYGRSSVPSADANRDDAVVLVTHMTVDRLPAANRWCRTWRGPMSVSLFARPKENAETLLQKIRAESSCLRNYADWQLVERVYEKEEEKDNVTDMMVYYPFNVQRNAALDGVREEQSAWVFLVDIDLVLMPKQLSSHANFTAHLHNVRRKFLPVDSENALIIIPAVETVNKEVPLPATLDELRNGLMENEVCSFYGHYCRGCHNPTQIRRFVDAQEPYLVKFEEGFEPYVVVNRRNSKNLLPRYQEHFIGRGWDKMSYFYELNLQKRPFVVFPQYFLAHHGRGDMPSTYTTDYMKRQEKNLRLNIQFNEQMKKKYSKQKQPSSATEQATEKASSLATTPGNITTFNWTEFGFLSDLSDGRGRGCRANTNATEKDLLLALDYACSRIDCSPLYAQRKFPAGVERHASWAFDRYVAYATTVLKEPIEVACHFRGAAKIVSCGNVRNRFCVPRPHAITQNATEMKAAIDWLCGHDGPLGGECVVFKTFLGWSGSNLSDDLEGLARMVFHAYYVLHRCDDTTADGENDTDLSTSSTCDFRGLAHLVEMVELVG